MNQLDYHSHPQHSWLAVYGSCTSISLQKSILRYLSKLLRSDEWRRSRSVIPPSYLSPLDQIPDNTDLFFGWLTLYFILLKLACLALRRASQLVTTPGYGFPANPTEIIKYLPLLSLYQANGQKNSTPSSLPTCAADDRAWHRKLPFNSLRRKSERSSIGVLFLSSARLCFCFPPFDLHLDKIVAGRYDWMHGWKLCCLSSHSPPKTWRTIIWRVNRKACTIEISPRILISLITWIKWRPARA